MRTAVFFISFKQSSCRLAGCLVHQGIELSSVGRYLGISLHGGKDVEVELLGVLEGEILPEDGEEQVERLDLLARLVVFYSEFLGGALVRGILLVLLLELLDIGGLRGLSGELKRGL